MNDELLAPLLEREVLSWSGASKEPHRGGPDQGGFGSPATAYKFGRRAFGHVHDIGVANLIFPR